MKAPIFIVIIVSLLYVSFNSNAHSEHDKARFVDNNGIDTGLCDQVLRPCKTIAYAVKQANKGDKILVASGKYEITSSDELFYLKSALVPILGGYNRFDHYQTQSPNNNITQLSNVPSGMESQLRKQGFNILSDGKSSANNNKFKAQLAKFSQLSQRQGSAACVNGNANGFSCENIDLLAHIPLSEFSSRPSSGNDIWGHVDLNTGNEFAIMGVRNGIVVFDVTDPQTPTEVGTIPGVDSSWRDIKVYQYFDERVSIWKAYAYATTEGSSKGATDYVSVIDLNNLPHSVSLVEKNRVVATAHNIYISNVDHTLNIALPNQVASLQLVGANNRQGAFQNYSLAHPETLPESSGSYYGEGYTHDGASLTIKDQRSQSNCEQNNNECTVFIDFNEKEMKLWNISDPENTKQLGSVEYFDVSKAHQYIHSGWGTEDQQYVLLQDEFDEYKGGLNTTVRIFSIENLANPVQVGQWTGPTAAIDHNGFVRGNRYYMSNYTRGLTILDISDPANPEQVGFFDTFPTNDSAVFHGAWGTYPYLPSGNILVSDIDSGLYILKDNTKTSTNGQLSFVSRDINTTRGVILSIPVQRSVAGDDAPATSVGYQVLSGSAKHGNDFTVDDGVLHWQENSSIEQHIEIDIAADPSNQQPEEKFFVRLYNPNNGATLGKYNYLTVNVEGVIDNGAASFDSDSLLIVENQETFSVNVNRQGSSNGEISFDYQLVAVEAELAVDIEDNSGRITWQDGDNMPKTLTFSVINDEISEENESFIIELKSVDNSRLGNYQTIKVTIADDENNTAPAVTLSEDFQVNTSQSVSLTAQVSDSENDEMSYQWTQTDGPNVSLNNANSLTTNFVAPTSGTSLTFEFTATDFRGASTKSTITLTVVAPPQPPQPPQKNDASSGGGSLYHLLFILIALTLRRRILKT